MNNLVCYLRDSCILSTWTLSVSQSGVAMADKEEKSQNAIIIIIIITIFIDKNNVPFRFPNRQVTIPVHKHSPAEGAKINQCWIRASWPQEWKLASGDSVLPFFQFFFHSSRQHGCMKSFKGELLMRLPEHTHSRTQRSGSELSPPLSSAVKETEIFWISFLPLSAAFMESMNSSVALCCAAAGLLVFLWCLCGKKAT